MNTPKNRRFNNPHEDENKEESENTESFTDPRQEELGSAVDDQNLKTIRRLARPLLFAALCLPASHAITIGGNNYVASGPTDALTSVFTAPTGGVTTNHYSALVQVSVSGSGTSLSAFLNDAFWRYTGVASPSHEPLYYQLAFSTSSLMPFDPSQDAKNFVVYDIAAGAEVTAPYVPSYSANHTYSFVLNTGLALPGPLYFGVSDGNFSDNSGAYTISVTQLVANNAVPDHGATALLLAGSVFGLLSYRRFQAKSSR